MMKRRCKVCDQLWDEHTPAGRAACGQTEALQRIAAALEKSGHELYNIALAVRR